MDDDRFLVRVPRSAIQRQMFVSSNVLFLRPPLGKEPLLADLGDWEIVIESDARLRYLLEESGAVADARDDD